MAGAAVIKVLGYKVSRVGYGIPVESAMKAVDLIVNRLGKLRL